MLSSLYQTLSPAAWSINNVRTNPTEGRLHQEIPGSAHTEILPACPSYCHPDRAIRFGGDLCHLIVNV